MSCIFRTPRLRLAQCSKAPSTSSACIWKTIGGFSWTPFIYFSALIAVAKIFKTMLNSSGESGHLCLVPDFRGNAFHFSPLRIMFAVGLLYMAFIMLRYVPSMPAVWRVFIINGR